MLVHKEQWTTKASCKFCNTEFTADADSILYGDLRPEFFLIPDYQYYIPCVNCGKNIIFSDIPSRISLTIQQKSTSE